MNYLIKKLTLICVLVIFKGVSYAGIITFDSHIDIPFDYMENSNHDPGKFTDMQVDINKMKDGGLDSAFFIVYVPQGSLTPEGFAKAKKLAEKKFTSIRKMTEVYSSEISLALNPEDIRAAKNNNNLSAAIGIENGYVIGNDISLLDYYYKLGARYMTLSHIGHNQIADSSIPSKKLNDDKKMHFGISSFGEEVILRMNEIGMIVDISHTSEEAALDAIEISKAPVIASHSCVKSIANHPRNISDRVLTALAKNGGVIQIVAFPNYVKVDNERFFQIINLNKKVASLYEDKEFIPSKHMEKKEYIAGMKDINTEYPLPSIDDLIDHIDYVVNLVGIDHVGLSSDFGGGGGIDGWMDASETNNLTNKLFSRGYSTSDIEKIWGGNIFRVWNEVETIAQNY